MINFELFDYSSLDINKYDLALEVIEKHLKNVSEFPQQKQIKLNLNSILNVYEEDILIKNEIYAIFRKY